MVQRILGSAQTIHTINQSNQTTILTNKKMKNIKTELLFSHSRPPIDDPTNENAGARLLNNKSDPMLNEYAIKKSIVWWVFKLHGVFSSYLFTLCLLLSIFV